MNKIYVLPEDELRGEIYQTILRLMGENWGTWESVVAAVGLFGGLLSIVLGGIAWAAFGLFAPAGRLGAFLDVAGTVLLVLPLPLLALGAYSLDRLEKKSSALPLPAEAHTDVPRSALRPHRAGRISRHILNSILLVFGLLLTFIFPADGRAQQTIFNVPSTDVLDRGKVYAELDVPFKPNEAEGVARFSSFVPRVVVGVGGRTEVGLNVTGNIQPGADTTTLVPAVKHKLYDGGDNGWAFVVGDNLFIPVRNRQYDAGNYSYAAVSKTFARTRLTAGRLPLHARRGRARRAARGRPVRLRADRQHTAHARRGLDYGQARQRLLHAGRDLQAAPEGDGLRRLFNRQRRRVARQPLLPAGSRLQLQLREARRG